MPFQLGDFKRVCRSVQGARVIYPHQIRDERYTASIGYAIGYYEAMVGRRWSEFEADALLEFFGEPRLARGLVACLAETYSWQVPDLVTALGEPAARALEACGLGRPADLRARLYELANERYGGFVPPAERRAALRELCPQLSVAQIERALLRDAQPEHVLVRRGPRPTPRQIVARYNVHSLTTALGYAEALQLALEGDAWQLLCSAHNLARRYRIGYLADQRPGDGRLDLTLQGQRDALGGWGRAGRRVVRALLRLLHAHPAAVAGGQALVHVGGQRATLRLDAEALGLLGALPAEDEGGAPWHDDDLAQLRRAWERAALAGATGGWRMRRDPEPLVGDGSLVVPDLALRRGVALVGLCVVRGRAAAQALAARLARLGGAGALVALADEPARAVLRRSAARCVLFDQRPSDALPALLAALAQIAPAEPEQDPMRALLDRAA